MEFRCDNNVLFCIVEDEILEVKCRNRRCGYEAGLVVLHQFDLRTGKLKGTQKFKDPAYPKGVTNATDSSSASVRSA